MDQFPRTSDLPRQSPVYWVGQKDRYLRQLLIRDIETLTHRRLVVYYANRFSNANIKQRDCAYFVELFGDVDSAPCDLLIETPGGETDATEGLVRLLRNLAPDLRVIVPKAAKKQRYIAESGRQGDRNGPGIGIGAD